MEVKTAKMTRLLGKTTLVITLIILGSCALDKHNIDGRLVKMDGKYYRLDNRMGNVYAFEEIQIDTITVCK